MKSERTILGHTVSQRRRLFALARLLLKVPARAFKMENWTSFHGGWANPSDETLAALAKAIRDSSCGYAGCAMGWGMTVPAISKDASGPFGLLKDLGFDTEHFTNYGTCAASRLFGPHRAVTPKRVATDIRRYLKTGELPA